MSTEYRRGIPSIAHVEAATRLGLEWEDDDVGYMRARWRLVIREEYVLGDYATSNTNYSNWDSGSLVRAPDSHLAYHPIRPDGTPVDWEVLDQEVARVGQRGQPQGFRADLWRRICRHFISADEDRVSSRHLGDVEAIERRGCLFKDDDGWQWLEDGGPTRTDILTRWTVYQELKPLYDLVDGGEGCPVMPPEMQQELGHSNLYRAKAYCQRVERLIDAVAERRVAERMRGQMQAPTVTSVAMVAANRT